MLVLILLCSSTFIFFSLALSRSSPLPSKHKLNGSFSNLLLHHNHHHHPFSFFLQHFSPTMSPLLMQLICGPCLGDTTTSFHALLLYFFFFTRRPTMYTPRHLWMHLTHGDTITSLHSMYWFRWIHWISYTRRVWSWTSYLGGSPSCR